MTEPDYEAAIALVGMAGRFPGADSTDELWDNLAAGRPGLRELSDAELTAGGVGPAQLADPSYVRTSGSITGHAWFDAGLFGFGRREAEVLDPQHRLFLESCYAALENAGYPPMRMPGKVGVFGGCGYPDYIWNIALSTMAEAGGQLMMAIGTERDSLTSLVSYKLKLRGPSATVQTFCSTSLVAVHLAAQSLLNFECDTALAGGAFVPLPQGVGYRYEEGGIYSPDGRVRAFDAGARGSVIGSGVSVVALKRLPDALRDGDHINALILGSAVNNDGGACAGYTAPGVDGQAEVIADALAFAGVGPDSVDYVECHGTGTVLGDSIEIAAMARAFPDRPGQPVVLGSLKAAIGHLDRAAGTSSLIRAALALRHRTLPATPNYRTPNPALHTARRKFTVLTETRPWPAGPTPRRAGVSAFGLGGTNAHVVLEEAPALPDRAPRPGPHLLVLSGRDTAAVEQATSDLARHLGDHPELPLSDVAFTLQASRSTFPVRRAFVCDDTADALVALTRPERHIQGEARLRAAVIELRIPDPGPVSAAEEQVATAASAVARLLRRLGLSVGAVSGPDSASLIVKRLRTELAIERDAECQASLTIAPDAASDAETDPSRPGHWLLAAVARLWTAGAQPDWAALHSGDQRRVPLPGYPFQRRRYWVDAAVGVPEETAPAAGRTGDLDAWTYAPGWESAPTATPAAADRVRAAGPWLVLAGEERAEAVVARLREAGAAVSVARLGAEFANRGDGEFVIRPGSGHDDLGKVLRALDEVPKTVVHGLLLAEAHPRTPTATDTDTDTGEPEPATAAGLRHALRRGYDPALALIAAYARHAPAQEVDLLALTEGSVGLAGTPPAHPSQAALAGVLPVLAQENPGWTCRHVDLDRPAAAGGPVAVAARVVDEAVADHRGPVALRGLERWVRTFRPLPLPEPEAVPELVPGSVVLITGGLGHVGLILARHLTLERGCRVVLTARTPLPPREEWPEHADTGTTRTAPLVGLLLELEGQGAEILTLAADSGDPEQMRAAVAAAEARFGPISLAVHAAGISDPSGFGPAHLIDDAGAGAHFTAKVAGFAALRDALAHRSVPGITLSSLSAVLGGLNLGPYAAANAALDAHLLAARAEPGVRWVTVDWDTWGRGGPDAGEFAMTPAQACAVFERAVAAVDRAAHLVISTGPLDRRYEQWVVGRGLAGAAPEADGSERDPRPDLSTAYVAPGEGLESELAEIWSRVLRVDAVGADDDFFQLGGSSVLAIELVARIRRTLRIPVPTATVMGFPTVRGLARQLDALRVESGG